MYKKLLGLVFAGALVVGAMLPGTVLADRPDPSHSNHGCPNAAAANGASHANENNGNSAHGSDKKADRGCA